MYESTPFIEKKNSVTNFSFINHLINNKKLVSASLENISVPNKNKLVADYNETISKGGKNFTIRKYFFNFN